MTTIVQISQEPGSVNEGDYSASWLLTRDDTTGPLTVTYQISGTAYPSIPDEPGIPGVVRDYMAPANPTVTFVDGEYLAELAILLDDDAVWDGDKLLTITLVDGATYDIQAGGPSTAILVDNQECLSLPPPPTFPACESCPAGSGDGVLNNAPGIVNPNRPLPGQPTIRNPNVPLPGASGIVFGDNQIGSQQLPADNPDVASQPVSLPNGAINFFGPAGFSSNPIRYFDGTVLVSSNDLASEASGISWGVTRSWSNGINYAPKNVVGNGMVIDERPVLIERLGSVVLITNGHTAQYFDPSGGGYTTRGFIQNTLTHDAENDELILTDSTGTIFTFHDFSTELAFHTRGQLKSMADPKGNLIEVTDYTAEGKIEEVQRTSVVGGTTIIESFLYTYIASGRNMGVVESVTLRRKENSGSWVTQRKAEYDYYDGIEDHGNLDDLKTATIKDGSNNILDTTYYRYYVASETGGYKHGLKFVVYPQSLKRLTDAEGTDLEDIADEDLAPFADHYFEYDSQQRATLEVAQGAGCSACSGGQGVFEFTYTTNETEGYNAWASKTVEDLPDGNQHIVYTNFMGQVMLEVYKDTTTNDLWATYFRFDSAGRVAYRAEPSAVSGYNDGSEDLILLDGDQAYYLRDLEGLITDFTYYTTTTATTSTAGGVAGYLQQVSLRHGEDSVSIPQSSQTYIARTADGTTVYLPAATTVYANTDGTGGLTTSYTYTFYAGTTQVESQTTTTPASDSTIVFYDNYGRPTWKKDAGGFIHYTAYDQETGAVTKSITDVDSSETGDFANKPSGWTTPSNGGLHLISTYEVDKQGRTTKETDANGNITYVVYDDVDKEVRIYPGWNTSTNTTTGPTIVMREDADGSYREVLTMSATPEVSSGRPTGAESISNLQSLTRTHLNSAGQAIYEDAYFSFASLTYSTSTSLGTEGTHYLRTEMGYDKRGRHAKTVRPDGTIYRTVFDGMGRPVSEWIGDDDTPTSGFWSPSNPADMITIKEYEYDGGDVGDSHLTSVTDAIGRETTLEYDFRGRLIETTLPDPDAGGALTSPVYATAYDNLGRVVSQTDALGNFTTYAYNTADGETTVTLPDPDAGGPLTSPATVLAYNGVGLLAAQTDALGKVTAYEFDGAGRLIEVTLPDPDDGGSQAAPVTEYEYDGAGNLRFLTDANGNTTEREYDKANRLIEVSSPDPDGGGSLTALVTAYAYTAAGLLSTVTAPGNRTTTYLYDALGRLTKQTAPDPDGAGGQAAAETEYEYDAASRIITLIDALDNETAYEYDLFDNVVEITAPDPDGGGSLTSPVTSYDFDNAGQLLEMIDPMGRETDYEYDGLGRRKKIIAADPDGAGSLTRPETTFTFDAASNLLQQIDPLGNRTVYQYDNLYRTIAEKQSDGNVPEVSITTTAEGGSANEVQRVGFHSFNYTIGGGTFTLTYGGETTDPIAWNASAATVLSALEALPNLGSGDVAVTKVNDTGWTQRWKITFQGSLANTNVSQITIDSSSVSGYSLTDTQETITQGHNTNEVKVVTLSDATGGTFTLSVGGQTTSTIAYNATAATVDSTLEALSTVDTVTVSGNAGGPYTITFTGTHVGQNVAPVGVDYSGLTNADLLTQTLFTFDSMSRMLSLTDPVGNKTTWQYDNLSRVTQETNQLNKTRTFKYDAVGNLTERVDRLGRKIVYEYDNVYRNTNEKWYSGTTLVRTLSFSYNSSGDLASASDPAATYSYGYDGLGRVTSEGQTISGLTPQLTYTSTYNALDRRTQLQAAIGSTNDFQNTYTFDNLSRLTRLQQQDVSGGNVVADKRIDFAYDASGAYTKIDRYADQTTSEHVVSTHYSYDGIGRLTKLLHTEGSTAPGSGWGSDALAGYEYVYDAASRFTSINSFVDGLTSYTHDAISQLTGADHTGQTDESYSYDANGNRTMSGYSTTDNNQLTTDGVYNYTYDDEGNRLTRTKISNGKKEEYTWDHRNRLTTITFKNSDNTVTKTVDQFYDVFNRWVKRCVDPNGSNDVDTFFSYEDGQIVLQFDDGGAASDLAHRNLFNPTAIDQLLADEQVTSLTSAGTVLWPLADHLGTLRDLATYNTSTDDTAIANHRRYASFGNLVSETNAAIDEIFGFTGRALDESTGLQNNLNRWYDSAAGRWISEDPIGLDGNDANISRYVRNRPIEAIDPTGLITIGDIPIIGPWIEDQLIGQCIGPVHSPAPRPPTTTPPIFRPSPPIFNPVPERSIEQECAIAQCELTSPKYIFAMCIGREPFDIPRDPCSVGKPKGVEACIPIWCTGRTVVDQVQNGEVIPASVELVQAWTETALTCGAGETFLPKPGLQTVTHWGPCGMTELQTGNWVQKGSPTYLNWFLSGKCQPGKEFAAFKNCITTEVHPNTLIRPPGWQCIKYGQRIYVGPNIPVGGASGGGSPPVIIIKR